MPGSSEDELLVQPLEQAHAETILQRLHLLPDRSGRDVQLVRRELQAQMACRGFERAQRVQWR
jgi:hypothetical protein